MPGSGTVVFDGTSLKKVARSFTNDIYSKSGFYYLHSL